MEKELSNIAQEMCEKNTDIDGIRQSARSMFDIAACNYNGHLLRSAINMVAGILQFANDLETPPHE